MQKQTKLELKDQYLKEIVGLSASQAKHFADLRGLSIRIIKENGTYMIVTRDHNTDRLNIEVIDDIIVKAHYG